MKKASSYGIGDINMTSDVGANINKYLPTLEIDASKYSSIYQDGAIVMPNHYIVEFYIKYK